jgi:hypothetical protein
MLALEGGDRRSGSRAEEPVRGEVEEALEVGDRRPPVVAAQRAGARRVGEGRRGAEHGEAGRRPAPARMGSGQGHFPGPRRAYEVS